MIIHTPPRRARQEAGHDVGVAGVTCVQGKLTIRNIQKSMRPHMLTDKPNLLVSTSRRFASWRLNTVRNMSFLHTAQQFLDGVKTVTRRLGWRNLKTDDQFIAVVRARGVRKEQIERLGICQVLCARQEPLDAIDKLDVIREGCPNMTPEEFIEMFCRINRQKKCQPDTVVTRIEFKRIEGS